jgi:hypothetical protein
MKLIKKMQELLQAEPTPYILIIMVLLILLAALTYSVRRMELAEDWVLWEHTTRESISLIEERWRIVTYGTTFEQCLNGQIEFTEKWKELKKEPNGDKVSFGMTVTYRCLQYTKDPREKRSE